MSDESEKKDADARARDARGRFKGSKGRRGRPSRSRCVGSGRGSRSSKTHLELARTLVDLDRQLRRLQGELGLPVDPLPEVEHARVEGLRRLQAESVARRRLAMDNVLHDLAERRVVPTATGLAESMRLALGLECFAVSQLYRPPLDTMWRELVAASAGSQSNRSSTGSAVRGPSDWLGRCPDDADPAVARHLRLPMKELHRRLDGVRNEISELSARNIERLISEDGVWPSLRSG